MNVRTGYECISLKVLHKPAKYVTEGFCTSFLVLKFLCFNHMMPFVVAFVVPKIVLNLFIVKQAELSFPI